MIRDFNDPSRAWRRLFAEVLGTFLLVLVAAGGPMVAAAIPGSVGRSAAVVAPGMMVMAIILFMGRVSGAHLNPAVSISSRPSSTCRRGTGRPMWRRAGRRWTPCCSRRC
jgi:aquaporin Z